MNENSSTRSSQLFQQIALLAGSFTFAFLLGELVHEMGHYLCHLAYGNTTAGVHLDPFGGSRITGVGSLPLQMMGITSVAGPLFNLVLGITCSLVFWSFRKPILLPFLLWGPVAMIQEGVTFTLGGLTPGGDAAWMAAAGLPWGGILFSGTLLLLAGLVCITLCLPLAGIQENDPVTRRLLAVGTGFCSLMVVRAVYSTLTSPGATLENLVPLIFALLLVTPVVLLQKPLGSRFDPRPTKTTRPITWLASLDSLTLGASMFVLQAII